VRYNTCRGIRAASGRHVSAQRQEKRGREKEKEKEKEREGGREERVVKKLGGLYDVFPNRKREG